MARKRKTKPRKNGVSTDSAPTSAQRRPAIQPGRVPGDQADVRVALAYLRTHSSWVCLAPGDAGDRGQLHPRAGAKTSGGMSGVMNV